MIEYNDEALNLVLDLKDKIRCKELEGHPEDIELIVFDNILQRRILLTKKMLVLDGFNIIFRKAFIGLIDDSNCEGKNVINIDEIDVLENYKNLKFSINDVEFNINQLLWTLKFATKLYQDNLTPQSIISTRAYLDANFDFESYQIKTTTIRPIEFSINSEEAINENKYSDSEISSSLSIQNVVNIVLNIDISNSNLNDKLPYNTAFTEIQSHVDCQNRFNHQFQKSGASVQLVNSILQVDKLQKEKSILESRKHRAETTLSVLKTFMVFKDNVIKHKKKYKQVLAFILEFNNGAKVNEIAKVYADSILTNETQVCFDEYTIEEDEIDFENHPEYSKLIHIILSRIEGHIINYVKDVLGDDEDEDE